MAGRDSFVLMPTGAAAGPLKPQGASTSLPCSCAHLTHPHLTNQSMPAGGGKSLCYALLPALRPGALVLVVSPLIALMQDQVQAFRARGLRADFLSSACTEGERRRLLEDLQSQRPATQASTGPHLAALPRACRPTLKPPMAAAHAPPHPGR